MPPKPNKGKNEEKSMEAMLEGISSAHSWIKAQSMLRPTKLGKKGGDGSDESGDEEEDILISLASKDPNIPRSSIKYQTNIFIYKSIEHYQFQV